MGVLLYAFPSPKPVITPSPADYSSQFMTFAFIKLAQLRLGVEKPRKFRSGPAVPPPPKTRVKLCFPNKFVTFEGDASPIWVMRNNFYVFLYIRLRHSLLVGGGGRIFYFYEFFRRVNVNNLNKILNRQKSPPSHLYNITPKKRLEGGGQGLNTHISLG